MWLQAKECQQLPKTEKVKEIEMGQDDRLVEGGVLLLSGSH